jgi:hypothetical protein
MRCKATGTRKSRARNGTMEDDDGGTMKEDDEEDEEEDEEGRRWRNDDRAMR